MVRAAAVAPEPELAAGNHPDRLVVAEHAVEPVAEHAVVPVAELADSHAEPEARPSELAVVLPEEPADNPVVRSCP